MVLADDEFLTVAEVAELLKLNQHTVRNWIDAGYLPAVRVGRRVRSGEPTSISSSRRAASSLRPERALPGRVLGGPGA
jgi:excisionase family DNA binding protein